MNELLKNINLGIAFFLELAMLAGFGYWGFYGEKSVWVKWILGIGLPVVAACIWWFFLAPKAVMRLNNVGGILLSSILFLLAAAALYLIQHRELAVVFGVVAVVNRILVLVWKQW